MRRSTKLFSASRALVACHYGVGYRTQMNSGQEPLVPTPWVRLWAAKRSAAWPSATCGTLLAPLTWRSLEAAATLCRMSGHSEQPQPTDAYDLNPLDKSYRCHRATH